MPNWCYNRIDVYGDEDTVDQIKEIHDIFADETDPFNQIFPIPDFKNIPNDKGELPVLKQEFNKDGKLMWETYNFPDGKNDDRWYHWCIPTGVQSGSLTLPTLNMQTRNSCNLHSLLRGVHPKELLKSCVRSIQTYHSLVSMMSQDVRLQGIIRTV